MSIRKVAFAASKADHATYDFRDNLPVLLDNLTLRAGGHVRSNLKIADPLCFASLRATQDADGQKDGQALAVLQGRKKGEPDGKITSLFPGRVPREWPEKPETVDFVEFEPKRVPEANGKPWPHLRLDNLLWSLLEDHLK